MVLVCFFYLAGYIFIWMSKSRCRISRERDQQESSLALKLINLWHHKNHTSPTNVCITTYILCPSIGSENTWKLAHRLCNTCVTHLYNKLQIKEIWQYKSWNSYIFKFKITIFTPMLLGNAKDVKYLDIGYFMVPP